MLTPPLTPMGREVSVRLWAGTAFLSPGRERSSSGRSARVNGGRAVQATARHAIASRASALGTRPIFGRPDPEWNSTTKEILGAKRTVWTR